MRTRVHRAWEPERPHANDIDPTHQAQPIFRPSTFAAASLDAVDSAARSEVGQAQLARQGPPLALELRFAAGCAMRIMSTRSGRASYSMSEAIVAGLAPDGGLYMPASLPRFSPRSFASDTTLAHVGLRFLAPFFDGDVLRDRLVEICNGAFSQEATVRELRADRAGVDSILELFHGPTAAFKDYGARFLAGCLSSASASARAPTVLVATSGDTGAAVAAAFETRHNMRVAILYPRGGVSARQEHQLGSFGDNVQALRVEGFFDDCQRLVKELLADTQFRASVPLSSANSISLGRLLPQAAYYAHASLDHWRRSGRLLNFVVPSGNLGNGVACVLARRCGLPIGRIVLATNQNDAIVRALRGEAIRHAPPRRTLANAMDVGVPSNLERLIQLEPGCARRTRDLTAEAVDDASIRLGIQQTARELDYLICPHTACAWTVLTRMRKRGVTGDWCAVATAHPAKFADLVEPIIGRSVPLPHSLQVMLSRPSRSSDLPNCAEALRSMLR